MPELPEVETIRRSLLKKIDHAVIQEIISYHPDVLMNFTDCKLTNWRVDDIRRRGKYLLFDLSRQSLKPTYAETPSPIAEIRTTSSNVDGGTGEQTSPIAAKQTISISNANPQESEKESGDHIIMLVHLRMTGKLLLEEQNTKPARHTHVRMELDNGYDLDFNDVRRFGRIKIFLPGEEILDHGYATLGPEPLGDEFTTDYFIQTCKRLKNSTIKGLLLNQTAIAGIGNIYADESLFRSGIRPDTKAGNISKKRLALLWQKIREVIAEAIGHRGTSFRDYVDGLGKKGNFQIQLAVYQRTGQPCPRCGNPIKRIKVAGRSTHYCPQCQKR